MTEALRKRAVAAFVWWNDYWFRPGPALDLAVVRILVVGFHLGFMLWWMPVRREFPALAGLPDWMYEPIGPLALMSWLAGAPWRPSLATVDLAYWSVVVAAPFALAGFRTRSAMAVVAVGSLLTRAYAWSFSEVHHPEAVMMFALFVLAASPSGAVLSIDRLLARRRADPGETQAEDGGDATVRIEGATWSLRLLRWLFALVYFSAGYQKLRFGGLDWLNGETLRYYLLEDGIRWGGLGLMMAELPTAVLQFLSVWTIWLETTFFLAVLFPSIAWFYVLMGVALHVGIYVTMRAPFFEYIAVYSVFVPWARLLARANRKQGRPVL